MIRQLRCPGGGRETGGLERVFDGDREAVEGADGFAFRKKVVGPLSLEPGTLDVHSDDRVDLGVETRDSLQIMV